MIWVLILTIVFLLVVVALETACLLLIARSEYVAISGVMRNGKKGTVKNRLVDSRSFQLQKDSVYQTQPNFDGDDFF